MVYIVKRIKRNDNNPYPTSYNPILDQSQYLAELLDGTPREIYVNIIAESMFSNVDSNGRYYYILKDITGHERKDDVIRKKDGYYRSHHGNLVSKCTTREVGNLW